VVLRHAQGRNLLGAFLYGGGAAYCAHDCHERIPAGWQGGDGSGPCRAGVVLGATVGGVTPALG